MSAFTKTVVGTDATVLSAGGDYLASFKKATFSVKRDTVDTTGANDQATSARVVRFGKSSASVSGFVRGTSTFATAFSASAETPLTLLFTEATGGDLYSLSVIPTEFSKNVGMGETEDSITFEVIGIPQYAASGGTLAPMTL